MTNEKLLDIMPGVSSIVVKTITGDYKLGTKSKIDLISSWQIILLAYLSQIKSEKSNQTPITK